jgi:hypothetical protein
MRLKAEREKEIRDEYSVTRDGIRFCASCEGESVCVELLAEIDALREKLNMAIEAIDEISIGGRPYQLKEISSDDVFEFAKSVLEELKKE